MIPVVIMKNINGTEVTFQNCECVDHFRKTHSRMRAPDPVHPFGPLKFFIVPVVDFGWYLGVTIFLIPCPVSPKFQFDFLGVVPGIFLLR